MSICEMRCLIDTQILIWAMINPEKLSKQTIEILKNNEIFVSQISLFEIAIKQKIGKLPDLPLSIKSLIKLMNQDNFNILPISSRHIETYHEIPLLENHRDPFDRLLLAITMSENIPIISADANFVHYISHIQLIKNE
jgi:PIN domain nuclease of toxin-antitoxin system